MSETPHSPYLTSLGVISTLRKDLETTLVIGYVVGDEGAIKGIDLPTRNDV